MNLVQRAADWLRNNHIVVNDDWLTACVEWIQEENRERSLSDDDINSQVYEQWLLADLHELETQCLPPEVLTAQKFELQGAYTLQIDSIVDVGVSFYSQQQKLTGSENANVHVNADEPTQKPWEAKPSRMLMMKITDGTHNVQGMEYRSISCLSPQTTPGSKILVYGTVLCRRGILMLRESNIKFLGGEVDTLVEANTMANILQSAMEGNEEHAGKEHKQEFSGSDIRHNKQPVTSRPRKTGMQVGAWVSALDNTQNRNQLGRGGGQQFRSVKEEPVTQNTTSTSNQWQNKQETSDYDALLEEDMHEFMEDMETGGFDAPGANIQRVAGFANGPQGTQKVSGVIKTDFEGLSRHMTTDKSTESNQTDAFRRSKKRSKPGSLSLNQRSSLLSDEGQSALDDDLVAMEFEDDMDFPDDESDFTNLDSRDSSAQSSNVNTRNLSRTSDIVNRNDNAPEEMSSEGQSVNQNTASNTFSDINLVNSSNPVVVNEVNMTADVSDGRLNMLFLDGHSVSTADRLKGNQSVQSVGNSCRSDTGSAASRNSASQTCTVKTETSVNPSSKQGTIDKFFLHDKDVIVKEEKGCVQSVQGLDVQSEYPFTYLKKLMSLTFPEQPTYHTVKAYISTLTSKLTSVDGKWTLTCKINDGTMAIDVDLSNQVLTNMIGFSHQEAQLMKQRIQTDRRVKEVLQEGIQQCQQKLIELMCLLELEVCARNPRPVIVATKPVTPNHINMLYNRVMESMNS